MTGIFRRDIDRTMKNKTKSNQNEELERGMAPVCRQACSQTQESSGREDGYRHPSWEAANVLKLSIQQLGSSASPRDGASTEPATAANQNLTAICDNLEGC